MIQGYTPYTSGRNLGICDMSVVADCRPELVPQGEAESDWGYKGAGNWAVYFW